MARLITIILMIFATWGSYVCNAQEFTPLVKLYDRDNYNADNQNWSVSCSEDGYVYLGNGSGMLSFDGYRWKIERIPGNKLVRSVFADGDCVYVGSHEEFGYFTRNSLGKLEYHSLSDLLDDYRMQNDEIWRILKCGDKVIFQSFTSFFVYDGESVAAFRMPTVCLFFLACGETILTSTEDSGLVSVDITTGELQPLKNVPFESNLVSILSYKDGRYMVLTYSDGLYLYDGKSFVPFRTEVDDELASWQPNYAVLTKYGDLVIGTKLKGALCVNDSGAVRWHMNHSNVLDCNTVLGIDSDMNGNLWMAMDGGAVHVRIDPSLAYIKSISPSVGSINSIFYQKPHLYMGTGQGLYVGELDKKLTSLSDIRPVKEILGNVWHINSFDSQVFCGTNYETFDISDGRISVCSDVVGGNCMDEGRIHGEDVIVQGTYTHPCIYTKKNGRWTFSHSLKGFMQPLSTIEIDYSGTIWAAHLYKGLYALRLSDDLTEVESYVFYPSLDGSREGRIRVYSVNNRVVFTDGKTGFYTYDYLKEIIVPFVELNTLFPYLDESYSIFHFEGDKYWFKSSSRAALVSCKGKEATIEDVVPYNILEGSTLDERQTITPVSENDCLIAIDNSLVLYHEGVARVSQISPDISISRICMTDMENQLDSLLSISPKGTPDVPYKFRNISMDFFVPHMSNDHRYMYSFRLDNQPWSALTEIPSVSYAYLKKGRHVIQARLCLESGEVLSETDYAFRVVVPFYMSLAATIFYYLLVAAVCCLGVYFIIRTKRDRRIQEEKEELESQIKLKSKELAASTMNLIQKNEILINIKKELDSGKTDKAISIIEGNLAGDEEWKMFETNFDNLHEHFFRKLRERYPSLTDNDLRFCAYLRLNLSSKDIASLMNISLKGVEAARARIRKKISLPSSKSLTAFMIELK